MSLFLKEINNNSSLYRSWTLKFLLLTFSVIGFGFSETGTLPIAFIITLLFFFITIRPNKSLSVYLNYPIEIKLLNLWFLFAFITGIFVSSNIDNFLIGIEKTFFAIIIVNFIVLLLLNKIELASYILLGALIAGIIQSLSVVIGVNSNYLETTGRAVGFTSNPNSLGIKMVFAFLALSFFLILNKFRIIYVVFSIILSALFISVIFESGSRKSLLVLGIIILAFIPLYITKNSNKTSPKSVFYSIVIIVIIAIVVSIYLPVLLEGSTVGNRIEMGEDRGGIEGDIRYMMYLSGIELFLENPVFGVGFNNFRNNFFTGQYSHSDYIETLSTTGLVGFIMYQSAYIIVLFRSVKIFIFTNNISLRLYAGMSIIAITALKVLGFGLILFYSPGALIVLGVFSAITFRLKNNKARIY